MFMRSRTQMLTALQITVLSLLTLLLAQPPRTLGGSSSQFATPYARSATSSGWEEVGTNSATGNGISNTGSSSTAPSIASASDGKLYIAWSESFSYGDSEIYVRHWDGNNWTEVGERSASGGGISKNSGFSVSPAIAVGTDGKPFVAWWDRSAVGVDAEIYVLRWNGSSWVEVGSGSASGGGISNNTGDSYTPAITFAKDGSPYVTWHDYSSGDGEIYVRRWNGSFWEVVGSGSASGGGISNNAGESKDSEIVAAADGKLYVTWEDISSGNSEVYLRRWNGSSWEVVGSGSASGGGISNTTDTSYDNEPAIALAADGRPTIAWRERSGDISEIYARRWNGSSWVDVGIGPASGGGISNNAGGSHTPALVIAADGRHYAAWRDLTGGDAEIYMRRWNGSSWEEVGSGSASGGGISNNTGGSFRPDMTVGADGRPYVTWNDDSSGNAQIYVKRLLVIPTVYFSSSSINVNENAGSATIEVTLSESSFQTVSVNYYTINGTATAELDYSTATGFLDFNSGDTSKVINLSILDDSSKEANETFNVTLIGANNASLGVPSTTTLTIIDDDENVFGEILLPVVTNKYTTYFEGPWEAEDNDSYQQANGPLRSGQEYLGRPEDEQDFFTIAVDKPGKINIDLLEHTGERVQLQLFYQTVGANMPVAFDISEDDNDYHITYPPDDGATAAPGIYYIWIYTDAGQNERPYTLKATYPMP